MGQKWDGGDVAFDPDTWEALGEHLLPGTFCQICASSRGSHRVAVALEDAGYIMHPTIYRVTTGDGTTLWTYGPDSSEAGALNTPAILAWVQAQGMAKTTRIDTQIATMHDVDWPISQASDGMGRTNQWLTAVGPTSLAQVWSGHRYGRQTLRPSIEPIIVCQWPYQGRPVDSIVETGAGALWIDGTRVKGPLDGVWGTNQIGCQSAFNDSPGNPDYRTQAHPGGRWPKNAILEHTPDCYQLVETDTCVTCKGKGRLAVTPYWQTSCHKCHKVTEGRHKQCPNCGNDTLETETDWTSPNAMELEPLCWHIIKYKQCTHCTGTGHTSTPGTVAITPLEGHRPNPVTHQADGRIQFNKKPPGYQKISYTSKDGTETMLRYACLQQCVICNSTWTASDKTPCPQCEGESEWRCPVRALDEDAGERKVGHMKPGQQRVASRGQGGYRGGMPDTASSTGTYGDTGSAHRFYFTADWSLDVAEQLASARPFKYCPKASRDKDRMWPMLYWARRGDDWEEVDYETYKALFIEEEEKFAETGSRPRLCAAGNIHVAVKPLKLTEWLARLVLPPPEYGPRRLLVPFCGTGSEMIGGGLAGFEVVEGVEMGRANVRMSRARLAYWLGEKSNEL